MTMCVSQLLLLDFTLPQNGYRFVQLLEAVDSSKLSTCTWLATRAHMGEVRKITVRAKLRLLASAL